MVRCRICRVRVEAGLAIRLPLGHTCSKDCLEVWRQGQRERQKQVKRRSAGTMPVWADQVALRRRVRTRDGFKCRFCGTTSELQVHHITYRSQQGSDDPTNLITLCVSHHAVVHGYPKRYQPLLRGVIWCHYVHDIYLSVPQMERWLAREEDLAS